MDSNKELNPDDPFFLIRHKGIFKPASLKKGDKIAIISPASAVKEEYVYGAMGRISEFGYEPVLMEYALGHVTGTYSASKGDRLMDLFEALEDSEIKAILCARGGYGCCQLLANLSYGMISRNPKWIIGFSDVSVLLALWLRSDLASIHGPMAKHLATKPADDPSTLSLFRMLENGGKFDYTVPPHPLNIEGRASGELRGGNLAVLDALSQTPTDILDLTHEKKDVIFFLEDINEPIYKVNRILWRLYLSGALEKVKGLVFGQFTDYKPDTNFGSMEEMIRDFIDRNMLLNFPVAFNFPVGHSDTNLPLAIGARVSLEVSSDSVSLRTTD